MLIVLLMELLRSNINPVIQISLMWDIILILQASQYNNYPFKTSIIGTFCRLKLESKKSIKKLSPHSVVLAKACPRLDRGARIWPKQFIVVKSSSKLFS